MQIIKLETIAISVLREIAQKLEPFDRYLRSIRMWRQIVSNQDIDTENHTPHATNVLQTNNEK